MNNPFMMPDAPVLSISKLPAFAGAAAGQAPRLDRQPTGRTMKKRLTGCALILASSSAARADMLRALGLRFSPRPAKVPEPEIKGRCAFRDFKRRIAEIAAAQAAAAAAKHASCYVLAADTAVWADGRMFGKPADAAEAKRVLRALSGRTHIIATALCLLAPPDKTGRRRQFRGTACARVAIRPLTRAAINAYVQAVRPADCAGAYALQHGGAAIIEKIKGEPSAVVGLPARLLARLLEKSKLAKKGKIKTCPL